MKITDACLAELRRDADIVAIAEASGIRLIKQGNRYSGLCPFHDEKSPSFSVRPSGTPTKDGTRLDHGLYKCFGCGASGDVFALLKQTKRLEFMEAAEYIADTLNRTLEYDEPTPGRSRFWHIRL